MAPIPIASSLVRGAKPQMIRAPAQAHRRVVPSTQSYCRFQYNRTSHRAFSLSARRYRPESNYKESFWTRLRKALDDTKIKWYPIPVGVGIGFLGLIQFYRVNEREKARQQDDELGGTPRGGDGDGSEGSPQKRPKIRPTGPWFVIETMATLPLNQLTNL